MENAPPRERKKKVQPNDKSEKKRQENEKRRAQPEVRLQAVVLSLHKAQNRVAKLKIEKEHLTSEMSSESEAQVVARHHREDEEKHELLWARMQARAARHPELNLNIGAASPIDPTCMRPPLKKLKTPLVASPRAPARVSRKSTELRRLSSDRHPLTERQDCGMSECVDPEWIQERQPGRTGRGSLPPRFDPHKENTRPQWMGRGSGKPKGSERFDPSQGYAASQGQVARKDVTASLKLRPDYKCDGQADRLINFHPACNVPDGYIGRKVCTRCYNRMKRHPVFGIGFYQARPVKIVTKTVNNAAIAATSGATFYPGEPPGVKYTVAPITQVENKYHGVKDLVAKSRNCDTFRRSRTKSSFPIAIAPKLL